MLAILLKASLQKWGWTQLAPAVSCGRGWLSPRRGKGRLEGIQLACRFLSGFHSVIQTLGLKNKVCSQNRVGTWAVVQAGPRT